MSHDFNWQIIGIVAEPQNSFWKLMIQNVNKDAKNWPNIFTVKSCWDLKLNWMSEHFTAKWGASTLGEYWKWLHICLKVSQPFSSYIEKSYWKQTNDPVMKWSSMRKQTKLRLNSWAKTTLRIQICCQKSNSPVNINILMFLVYFVLFADMFIQQWIFQWWTSIKWNNKNKQSFVFSSRNYVSTLRKTDKKRYQIMRIMRAVFNEKIAFLRVKTVV